MEDYRLTEKAALVAVQSILNTRGAASRDKANRLRMALGQLPPRQSLVVLSEIAVILSERLDSGMLFEYGIRKSIADFSRKTVCFYNSDGADDSARLATIAKHLFEVIFLFKNLIGCRFTERGYSPENIRFLIELMLPMARRSADQASGISVLPMAPPPIDGLMKLPVSPKIRPTSDDFIGLGLASRRREKIPEPVH